MPRVTLIDYGMGNVFSVSRALETCGASVHLTSSPDEIVNSDYLVLPGVGAFGQGMDELQKRDLIDPILEFVEKRRRPFLGICLGMQMLLEQSEEAPGARGLSLIPGSVVAIPTKGADGKTHKIPHIGWKPLQTESTENWAGTCLQNLGTRPECYFVHSYIAKPSSEDHILAYVDYDGLKLPAAVHNELVAGTQFHPEKSGPVGLRIIENFLKL